MRRFLTAYMLALLLCFAGPAFGVAVDEKPLADPVNEAAARALMKEIRCLVCQNQSIEDSNSDLAKDLRMIVRERVQLGDTPADVRAYLVDRYGDWVLLDPPLNKMTVLLWGSPFLFLAFVLYGVLVQRPRAAAAPLSKAEEAKLAQLIKKNDTP